MGIGAAMAGGNPREGRVVDDYYPTPREVTRAALKNIDLGRDAVVLEPAAGCRAMADEIEAHGYTVVATDIRPRAPRVEQMDFFDMKRKDCIGVTAIITNPPFSLAERFIRHAREELGVPFLMLLLKSSFWHARSRTALFDEHRPAQIWALNWRPDFLGRGGPTMECSWMIWSDDHHGPTRYHVLAKNGELL